MTPPAGPRVLITRAMPDARETAAQVSERGGVPVIAPILEIALAAGPPPDPAPDAVLAFTSANGVRAYAAAGGPPRPAWCVGPVTARAAEAAGLAVAGIAGGDVASLAGALRAAKPTRVMHVRGAHAAGNLTAALRAAGLTAEALVLYEAQAAKTLPEAAVAALRGGTDALLFSPRSARLLGDLMMRAGLGDALADRRVGMLSSAVAAAFTPPVGTALIPPSPTSSRLVDFLLRRRT